VTLVEVVRKRGPITVAAFMDLALYDPRFGYYTRAAQRSGRAGDFFTSVDVGSLFGELLATQIVEMATIVAESPDDTLTAAHSSERPLRGFGIDLVEVGAGNGRLSADILRATGEQHAGVFEGLRLHLVEASPAALAAQRQTLGDAANHLTSSGETLPASFEGVVLANELLDAMPVHRVVSREGQLREVYVDCHRGKLVAVEGPPSTPDLAAYLARVGATLEDDCYAEINLRAVDWIADVARRLRRGFVIVIDYGHEARELYSVTHSSGTLTTFTRHSASAADSAGRRPPWLERPGDQDLTAHVDFTGLKMAAEHAGLTTLGFLDQTYFLMALLSPDAFVEPGEPSTQLRRRLALKTLIQPGGLGSSMKVIVFAKGVGTPTLRGCSGRARVT
jgi:SAM-dependent MidA family methyltransferase